MSDMEDRLRAALRGFTAAPPAGLLDAVRRRRQRRTIRTSAGLLAVAVAAALAVPPLTSALRAAPGGISGGGAPPSASPVAGIRAAPGTVLSDCARGPVNLGALGTRWRDGASVHAGPVWFLSGGVGRAGPGRHRLSLYVTIVVLSRLRAHSLVVLRVARADRGSLRFLYGPADSMNAGTRYTMRSGEAGLTLEACPAYGPMPTAGITDYYGGFLVRANRCVSVRVWVPGRATPYRVHLGGCVGR
jgi:hypothetical protein